MRPQTDNPLDGRGAAPAEAAREISQEAAQAMRAALVALLHTFPNPVVAAGKRLRIKEVGGLNLAVILARDAIAAAAESP